MNFEPNLIVFYTIFSQLIGFRHIMRRNYERGHLWSNTQQNKIPSRIAKGQAFEGGTRVSHLVPPSNSRASVGGQNSELLEFNSEPLFWFNYGSTLINVEP